jgi:hypothetical protein
MFAITIDGPPWERTSALSPPTLSICLGAALWFASFGACGAADQSAPATAKNAAGSAPEKLDATAGESAKAVPEPADVTEKPARSETFGKRAASASEETAEVDSDGFQSLFNGRDLSGWVVHEGSESAWSAID